MIKRAFVLVASVLKKYHDIITLGNFAVVAIVAIIVIAADMVAVSVHIIVACILLRFLARIVSADVGRLSSLDWRQRYHVGQQAETISIGW